MTSLVEHRTTDDRNSLESEAIYNAKEILIEALDRVETPKVYSHLMKVCYNEPGPHRQV